MSVLYSDIFATRETDVTVARTVIPNPPYSRDLAPSDFHLFGPVWCTLRTLFCYDNKLKHSVCEELGCFSKEFVRLMYSMVHKGGKRMLIMKGSVWKNDLDNVKDVPTIHVNLIVTVIIKVIYSPVNAQVNCLKNNIKIYISTFAASYLNTQGLNNSCLKSPASTLVDLTFQSRALRSFSLNQLRNLSL